MTKVIFLAILILPKFFTIISPFAIRFAEEINSIQPYENRTAKFFPIWGVGFVRFENGICTSGDSLLGTCYTKRQCSHIDGGVGIGSCASGIGVCCVVQLSCGTTSSANNTYFVNSNFPQTYNAGSSCTLTIQKCNSDICQVRIDFLTLSLAQPNASGFCVNDALYVIGGASTVPVLCGENSGQHIYVNFNGDHDIQIVIKTNSAVSFGRAWNIKVAQIGCDCPTLAPAGCLQYYTALSGTVTSFNYGSIGTLDGTRQIINENYGVCVEMQAGYCSIQWSECSGDAYAFTVSGNTTVDTAGIESITGENCTTDFVVIPNPIQSGVSLPYDRFCGNYFPTVTTFSKPFVLTVVTDGAETDDSGNRGFCLSYTQKQCTGTLIC